MDGPQTMISNAPTDNLYKFITFLGITLLMFSIWTLSEIEKKNSENRLRAELELLSRADNKEIDLAPINNEYRRLSILTQKYEILEDGEHRRRIENQIQQSQERIDLLRFELNSYITKIKEKNESTVIPGLYAVAPNPQKTILYLGAISGAVMTIIGFLTWYLFHQKYQDILLRRQVQNRDENTPEL